MGKRAENVEWNGRVYRRYPDAKSKSNRLYFRRSTTAGSCYLHRDVWEAHHGPIPPGHQIHHRDGNPGNNDLGNLECVSAAAHHGLHPWSDDRRAVRAEFLATIRPLTKAWHASPEGLAKHREVGGLAYQGFTPEPKPCEHCGRQFEPGALGNRDRFCSNACKSAWRRASGLDDEDRICACCGGAFRCNRYKPARTCGRACSNRLRAREKPAGL